MGIWTMVHMFLYSICYHLQKFLKGVRNVFFFLVLKVPPPGKGALYIRPLLIGSGAILGLAPAPEYTFLIYASPVGDYHKVSLCCVAAVMMNTR